MQYSFLRQTNSNDSLLLFFNGWGMASLGSADIFDRGWGLLASELIGPVYNSPDILEFFDYTQSDCGLDMSALCQRYKTLWLLSWSFGVAVAAAFWPDDLPVSRAIAVNGTLLPVSEQYGISPAVFEATLSNWSSSGQESFNRRICRGREQLSRFADNQPQRPVASQKRELEALQHSFEQWGHIAQRDLYHMALCGGQDRIFMSERQVAFWQNTQAELLIRNCAHWPL
ncbi:MAG: DUF452 family protein [Sedimentisphaerales bacterium]|nr:DUF452 family protein [Sedimentisphaerales bacterium]